MANSRLQGNLALLDYYKSPSTAATKTWTPASGVVFEKYKAIKIYINGVSTAALALRMKLSGLAAGYYTEAIQNFTTTLLGIEQSNTAFAELINAALMDASKAFVVEITLQLNAAQINYTWEAHVGNQGHISGGGTINDTTIDSIEILTSTSTWAADTTIAIYGIS